MGNTKITTTIKINTNDKCFSNEVQTLLISDENNNNYRYQNIL